MFLKLNIGQNRILNLNKAAFNVNSKSHMTTTICFY